MNFGEVNRKLVLFHVGFVCLLEAAVGSLGLAQRFVQVEVMRTGVDDAAGDVGAVVGCALKVGQKIGEDKASLNAAMALLHAQAVARAHLLFERVDDLLERRDQRGDRRGLRHRLYALGLLRALQQPEDPLFQAEDGVYQHPRKIKCKRHARTRNVSGQFCRRKKLYNLHINLYKNA